jgi:hypothetical protein
MVSDFDGKSKKLPVKKKSDAGTAFRQKQAEQLNVLIRG